MPRSRPDRRAADRGTRRSGRERRRYAPPSRAIAFAGTLVVVAVLGYLSWLGLRSRAPVRDGSPSWSPDGKRIAFYSERDGKGDLFLMDADGGDVQELTTTPADEGSPAFSPDGQQIAFDSDRDGNFEIYVMTVASRRTRRLTTSPSRDVSPAWSPDGRRIVFMSDRAASPEFDAFTMNAEGGEVERVTTRDSTWFPQFSHDGRKLAFHVWRDVHVLDLETRVLKRLTREPADGMYPTWSPDGTRLAFMSSRGGKMEIFTMGADGSEPTRLVTAPSGGAIDPRWSPDGTRIAYVQVSEATTATTQQPDHSRAIYVVEVNSGRVTRLSR
jgi:Tol biopolymer transport system component